jgi:hypothetical protein
MHLALTLRRIRGDCRSGWIEYTGGIDLELRAEHSVELMPRLTRLLEQAR